MLELLFLHRSVLIFLLVGNNAPFHLFLFPFVTLEWYDALLPFMCQSSFSLVVIAKIASCFSQNFSPHGFLLMEVSVSEGHDEKLCFVFFNIFRFLFWIWFGEKEHVHSPVSVPSEVLVTASLLITSQWYFGSYYIRLHLTVCHRQLVDETGPTVPGLFIRLLSFDCGNLNVPWGFKATLCDSWLRSPTHWTKRQLDGGYYPWSPASWTRRAETVTSTPNSVWNYSYLYISHVSFLIEYQR